MYKASNFQVPLEIKRIISDYYFGIIFAIGKIIYYIVATCSFIFNWEEASNFFNVKMDLIPDGNQISVLTYSLFSTAYIICYVFLLIGILKLSSSIKLLRKQKLFHPEISLGFKKAGYLFLVYILGTYITDYTLYFITDMSSALESLFFSEMFIFLLLTQVIFFVSYILSKGVVLKEEIDLTI